LSRSFDWIGGGVWLRQDVPADTLVEAPVPLFHALAATGG